MPNIGDSYTDAALFKFPEGFKNAATLTNALRYMFMVSVIMILILMWFGWLDAQMWADAKNGLARPDTSIEDIGLGEAMAALGGALLFFATVIVFLVWVYRANNNARALGAEGMTFTSGWSVGWYFVPFANLYKPFKSMDEIYKASKYPPSEWKDKSTEGIVRVWWALWIVSTAINQHSLRKGWDETNLQDMYESALWGLAEYAIDIPFCIVTLILITRIYQMQMNRVRRIA